MKNISTSIAARKILDYHSGAIQLKDEELEAYSHVLRQAAQNRKARLNETLWNDKSGRAVNFSMSSNIDFKNIVPGSETQAGRAVLKLHDDLKNL